jgi:2-dehydro-3-deoxygluconokinase
MSYGLNLQPTGALDFLSLGALVHRLDPGVVPFRKARHCDIHVSGGEYNVAANLSDGFGMKAGVATALVDYPIGHLIAEAVRTTGVRPFYKHFAHNGVTGPNHATVYSDRGYGVRAPVVFYNRANEAAALLKPGDFDWDAIFSGPEGGVRWFHSGGIFAALADNTAELILEAMQAAKRHGVVTSFDLNYRAQLWNARGGDSSILQRIAHYVDVIVGNEEDLQKGLGIPGPDVASGHKGLDPTVFFGMMEKVKEMYPEVKVVATTLREVHSANRHSWGAVAWINGQTFVSPTAELDVLDRIGGGDGFAAGFFYGLLTGASEQEAVNWGWAHGALLTTFPGDVTMSTVAQVKAFAKGGSARVQR